jgi:hypothetical protein
MTPPVTLPGWGPKKDSWPDPWNEILHGPEAVVKLVQLNIFCAIAAGPSKPNVTTAREKTARGLQNSEASRKTDLRKRDEVR